MKKKVIITIGILLTIIFLSDLVSISRDEIWGVYINNNTQPIVDGPYNIEFGIDSLKIYGDNRFVNKSWGIGNYIINDGLLTTEIVFRFENETGYSEFSTRITKPLFGEYKIWLNKDLNFYYIKTTNK